MRTWSKKLTFVMFVCLLVISASIILCGYNYSVAYGETVLILEDGHTTQQENPNQCFEIFSEDGSIEKSNVLYEESLIQEEQPSSRSVQVFNERKLLYSGRPDEYSIVMTIMGDGFTASEQDAFIENAQSVVDHIFGGGEENFAGLAPFNQYKHLFTIYAIEVVSEESGVNKDFDEEIYEDVNMEDYVVNNYFGSSFYYGSYETETPIERALVIENYNKVNELKKPYSAVEVVICNSNRWGGTGGQTAVISKNSNNGRMLAHEIGHTLASLADEYYYPEDNNFNGHEAINMTSTNNLEEIKWAEFVGQDGIGAFPLSHNVDRNHPLFDDSTDNWFKPSEQCMMRDTNEEFCRVCEEGLIDSFANILGESFYSDTLTLDIFDDFGYSGSDFSWMGKVVMEYNNYNLFNSYGVLCIKDHRSIQFILQTKSSNNAILAINGTVAIEIHNSQGNLIESHISSVGVSVLNNASIENATFSLDTESLANGLYTITLTSNFSRGTWEDSDVQEYEFAINRDIEVLSDFGYKSSWYKWEGNVKLSGEQLYLYEQTSLLTIQGTSEMNFQIGTSFVFNAVKEMTGTITITLKDSAGNIEPINGNNTHTSTVRVGLASNVSITNSTFSISPGDLTADTYTLTLNCRMTRDGTTYTNSAEISFEKEAFLSLCVAEGSMITLADGSQKAVEDLTGEEMLLVWNMLTGEFDSAPIVFIDSEPERYYEVINLYFSDGTTVKVISEHAFWDINLNKYVYLRSDAAQYIGHWFNKQTIDENGNMVYTEVQLTNVVVQQEYTSAWSPVTYGHLCYYVNGMLSMPGGITGLFNIFEVDPETMTIDQEAYLEDIEEYGLFTYEEFNALCPIPEAVFNAFGGQYLKVSLGKGLITWEELENLILRYSEFWN